MKDSLLKDFEKPILDKKDNNYKENTQQPLKRESIYMMIKDQPYDKELKNKYTSLIIDGTVASYKNLDQETISFDLKDIKKIIIDLDAKFLSFGLFSEFVFIPMIDIIAKDHTYLFKVRNKDDFIAFIHLFHNSK